MSLSTLIGLSGISLLLCVALLRFLILFNLKKSMVSILLLLFFFLTFVSMDGYSINQYFRGIFNDLSISSLILAMYYLFTYNQPPIQTHSILRIIALSGVLFYPLALGFGPIDPYAWGYFNNIHAYTAPLLLLLALFILLTYAFYKKDLMTLICLPGASLAFQLNLLESRNLWDYLLDPLIFIFALFSVLISIVRQQRSEITLKSRTL